jgi:antitoxin VapB
MSRAKKVEWCKIGVMALNIKNPEVEQLAADVAEMAHETKTEAIRRALLERRDHLRASGVAPRRNIREYLEKHVWPTIPPEMLDKPRMTREEEKEILGYGPEGF